MKITSFVAITLALVLSTTAAEANRRSFGGGGSSNFQSNGKFGLGLELGEPTGLNGKLFLTPNQAIDFGIGDLYHNFYVDGDGIHLYFDYMWHPFEITQNESFKLPFYVGLGGRVWFFDYSCRGGVCSSASIIGLRVPLGMTFDLNNVPLDIFLQFVPTLDFYRNFNGRSVYLDVDFSVGIRYWFS
jgi:hypothetical protein